VLRSVAVPTEHGGWGLTLEPALLGLLVAPSVAGVFLALAALLAFMARTPLKVVLVDRRRGRRLERTTTAGVVFAIEIGVVVALVVAAVLLADGTFWVPALVAAPLVVLELWFDMRSRSRRTIPELAGSVGICSVAAMIVLADGKSARLAVAVWIVLAARAITAIPFVRAQIGRLHHRPTAPAQLLAVDAAALAAAAVAVSLEPSVVAGAVAVLAIVVIQRITARGPVPRPAVLGMRQLALGLTVVAATAVGVLVS
jgi:hypothetical protein